MKQIILIGLLLVLAGCSFEKESTTYDDCFSDCQGIENLGVCTYYCEKFAEFENNLTAEQKEFLGQCTMMCDSFVFYEFLEEEPTEENRIKCKTKCIEHIHEV